MLSAEFVNGKDLRVQIGLLNKAEVLKEKLKTVGIKKGELVDNFLGAVESIPEDSPEAKKIPESVTVFYNGIVEGKDPTPEEQEAMKKKKSTPRGPSREQKMYDFVKAGASDEEILKDFTEFYSKKGQSDEKFIAKRIAIYKNIAKKRIAKETGGDQGKAEAKEEKKEEKAEA